MSALGIPLPKKPPLNYRPSQRLSTSVATCLAVNLLLGTTMASSTAGMGRVAAVVGRIANGGFRDSEILLRMAEMGSGTCDRQWPEATIGTANPARI
jgi:hypothetical protein